MGPGETEKGQVGGLDHFWLLWRRKWVIAAVAVGVGGIIMWGAYRVEPLYEAKVTVQLTDSGGSVMSDRLGAFLEGGKAMESEIEVLRSRVIGERTAVRLQMHYALDPLPPGVSLELSNVGVTPDTLPGVYAVTFLDDAGQYQVKDPRGSVMGLGRPGQPFEAGGLSFTLSKVSAPSGSSVEVRIHSLADLGEGLRGKINVVAVRGTNIIDVRVKMNEPQEAARTANAVAGAYVEFRRQQNLRRLTNVREFLERQLAAFRQDLLNVGEEVSRASKERQAMAFGQLAVGNLRIEMARRLMDLEMDRIALSLTRAPGHYEVVKVEREIEEIRNRLTKQLRPAKEELPLLEMLQGTEVKLAMYRYMLQKQQETRLAEAAEVGAARIVDRAIPPKAPVSPNISRSAKLGGILGLALGVGIALFLDYVDRSVKNVKDAEDRVGLPVLGAIPEIAGKSRAGRLRWSWREKKTVDPDKLLVGGRSPEVEAYRLLRANVLFAISEAPSGVFLFTSAGPGEGKSLTLANLAIALSQMKKRVLIVDVDLRRPVQHRLFRVPGEPGIANVLQEGLPWQEAAKPTDIEGLHVIPFGGLPPDSTELLGGDGMREFLRTARREYDLVLLDSPPVLLYADSCHLAAETSGVFVVARTGVSTPEDIRRTCSVLEAANAKVTGLILNRIPSGDGFGTYKYRYYYDYDSDEHNGDPSGKRLKRVAGRLSRHVRRF